MKKILLPIVIVSMMAIAAIFTSISYDSKDRESILMKNVEALADGEAVEDVLGCYSTMSSEGEGNLSHYTFCGSCTPVLCRTMSDYGICKVK